MRLALHARTAKEENSSNMILQETTWQRAPKAPQEFIEAFPSYPPQLLEVLWARNARTKDGLDELFGKVGLERLPDPFAFKDMDKAVARLEQAKEREEHVLVYADYDTDGVSAGALLVHLLERLSIAHSVYIPDQYKEPHGIGSAGVAYVEESGATLVITVDCGIANTAQISKLRAAGIETIVLDHHEVEHLPEDAAAVVDAKRKDATFPFRDLCGTGVALMFARAALMQLSGKRDADDFTEANLDLAAVATVADVVPLYGLNRDLVRLGLERLRRSPQPGLAALMKVARADQETIDARSIAFDLSPRINAASRMDHANAAFALLVSKDEDEDEAFARAKKLDAHNRKRRTEAKRIVSEAAEKLDALSALPQIIVLAKRGWPRPLLSSVSPRLADRYRRPVFVFELREGGVAWGSARSIPGFDLVAAMRACGGAELFEEFGGHEAAAGCQIQTEWLPLFEERLKAYMQKMYPHGLPVPTITVDTVLMPHEVSEELLRWFDKLEPFGKGNPRPTVLVQNLEVLEAKPLGKNGNRMKLRLAGNGGGRVFTAVTQYRDNALSPVVDSHAVRDVRLRPGERIDVVGELRRRRWGRGNPMEFLLIDFRPTQESPAFASTHDSLRA